MAPLCVSIQQLFQFVVKKTAIELWIHCTRPAFFRLIIYFIDNIRWGEPRNRLARHSNENRSLEQRGIARASNTNRVNRLHDGSPLPNSPFPQSEALLLLTYVLFYRYS